MTDGEEFGTIQEDILKRLRTLIGDKWDEAEKDIDILLYIYYHKGISASERAASKVAPLEEILEEVRIANAKLEEIYMATAED